LWIVNNIDRFIIFHFMPDASYVGIFDIAVKITLFLEIFQMGLMNTINPKIFSIWKENNLRQSTMEVNRYYNGFTALTMIIIPLMLIAFPLILPLVIKNPVYYQALAYLPLLSLGFVTRGWFYMFMAPIYYFKKTKVLPRIFLFSAIFQVVSSILLIRYFGIMGAVWANFLVKPVQAIILYTESKKIFSFSFNRWKIIYLPVLFIFIGIFCEMISTQSTRILIQSAQFLLTVGLVFLIYRNELIPLIKQWLRLY
jgi:O-antigen/teichoic acid export membrane protein